MTLLQEFNGASVEPSSKKVDSVSEFKRCFEIREGTLKEKEAEEKADKKAEETAEEDEDEDSEDEETKTHQKQTEEKEDEDSNPQTGPANIAVDDESFDVMTEAFVIFAAAIVLLTVMLPRPSIALAACGTVWVALRRFKYTKM